MVFLNKALLGPYFSGGGLGGVRLGSSVVYFEFGSGEMEGLFSLCGGFAVAILTCQFAGAHLRNEWIFTLDFRLSRVETVGDCQRIIS